MKTALRSIGVVLGLLGVTLIILHLNGIEFGTESASLVAGGARWSGSLAPDDIEARSRVMGSVGVIVGVLTTVAGVALVLLRRWAIWFALVPVSLTLLFAPFSRLILPPHLRFTGPDIWDFAEASVIAVVVSAAVIFRNGLKDA